MSSLLEKESSEKYSGSMQCPGTTAQIRSISRHLVVKRLLIGELYCINACGKDGAIHKYGSVEPDAGPRNWKSYLIVP